MGGKIALQDATSGLLVIIVRAALVFGGGGISFLSFCFFVLRRFWKMGLGVRHRKAAPGEERTLDLSSTAITISTRCNLG